MKRFALFLAPLMAITFLTNCGNKTDPTPPGPKQYTVTFNSNGGSEVPTQVVEENKYAVKPTNPSKDTPEATYTFVCWELDNKEFNFETTKITSNITLIAKWNKGPTKKYTITWKMDDGTTLDEEMYNYGETPSYKGIIPTKPSTDQYVYIFSNWSPNIAIVTGACSYVAQFKQVSYLVTTLTANITKNTLLSFSITNSAHIYTDWGDGSIIKKETSHTYAKDIESCNIKIFVDTNFAYELKINDGKTSITSVKLEGLVTSISDDAFSNCPSLTSVSIPNSVTNIGKLAFNNCPSLQFNEKDNALYLGNESNKFHALIKAKETTIEFCLIDDNCKMIADCAFKDCPSLSTINIPNSVISIGDDAFNNCSSLAMISISNSVTSIGKQAFYNCSILLAVNIPSSVTKIGDGAFFNCSSLMAITVDSNNPNYDSRNNCNAIIRKSDNALIVGCKSTKIPNSVTSINENSFNNCVSMSFISIPNSVISIGSLAFNNCSSLAIINIPNSVISIGSLAFNDCSSMAEIYIEFKESEKPAGWSADWLGNIKEKVHLHWGSLPPK